MDFSENIEVDFEDEDEDRKLNSFSNRVVPIRIFIEALHKDDYSGKTIYFHGNGGNGKSLLLAYLHKNFCKRVDNATWIIIKDLDDEALRDRLLTTPVTALTGSGLLSRQFPAWKLLDSNKTKCESVPSVLIDFGELTNEVQPQNPFSATCYMRKMLAGKNLRFVLFDYAYVLYLTRIGKLNEGLVKSVICDGAIDEILEFAKASSELLPGSSIVLKLLQRAISDKMFLYFKQRKVDEQFLTQLRNIKSNSELEKRMPYLFALDLVASMRSADSPPRLVLFFDTHEKLWLTQRDLSPVEYFRKDAWLRIMLNVLQTSGRIVTVVAGREPPRWSEAHKNAIPADRIIAHPVGLIPLADARESLEKRGIYDVALREAIVRYTEVEQGEVHPMYLGICADAVHARLEKGIAISPDDFKTVVSPEKLGEEVLLRLLSDVAGTLQPAIIALSVCRSFNYAIFRELAQKSLGSSGDRPVFEQVLTKYSFVKKLSGGYYQIHQLVRKLIEEVTEHDGEIRANREVLEHYFLALAQNGDEVACVEAIYYANQLDPGRGVDEWLVTFRDRLERCQWELCGKLSELSQELTFVTSTGLAEAMQLMGQYYQRISFYTDAKIKYLSALSHIDAQSDGDQIDAGLLAQRCAILNNMVDMLSYLSEHKQAAEYFQMALSAYQEALQRLGSEAEFYSGKGEVLCIYGYAQERLSDMVAAEKMYIAAVEACDQALLLDQTCVDGHKNKARALRRLSEFQGNNGRGDEAAEAISSALNCVEEALRLQPDKADLYRLKGMVLAAIGNHYQAAGKIAKAKAAYEEAGKWIDQSLAIAPKNEQAIFEKGIIFCNIAELLTEGQTKKEAELFLNQGIDCYRDALIIAPQSAWVHCQQATALQRIANLRALEKRLAEAMVFYQSAVQSIDNALKIAPNEAWLWNIKGTCLRDLGMVQNEGGDGEMALESFQEAYRCCDKAVNLTPQFASAHINKGDSLHLLSKLGSGPLALEQLLQAVASYGQASQIDPKNFYAYFSAGISLLDFAELQNVFSETALDSVVQSAECFDKALWLNPNDIEANLYKGWALLECGRILKAVGRSGEAEIAYSGAIDSYGIVLRLNPGNESANRNIQWIFEQIKGTVLAEKLAAKAARDALAQIYLIDEQHFRKPLDLGLAPVDEEQAQRFLADICATESPELSAVLATVLPFSEEYRLYQYTDRSTGSAAVYYYLYKPGDARLLNWTFAPLQEMIANGALVLKQETIIPYVRFFAYFVRVEFGNFIFVESSEDIVWRPEASEQDRFKINQHLRPLAFIEEDDEAFWLNGMMLMKDVLVNVDIVIPKKPISIKNGINGQMVDIPNGFVVPVNEKYIYRDMKVALPPGSEKFFETITKNLRANVASHDLNDEQRYRIPLNLGLKSVSEKEAGQFLEDIYAPESPEQSEIKVAKLPFYEEYRLYQYTDKTVEPAAVYYYLYKPGDARLLNWTNAPIYLLNEDGAFKLTIETVIDYAKFFFYFVRGDLGMFIIVEKPQDLVWLPEAMEEEKAAVENLLMPVTYKGIDEKNRYVLSCTIIFKDALFRSDIIIAREDIKLIDPDTNEEIEMKKGELLLANEELLCEEQQVPLQPPPDSVKARKLAANKAREDVCHGSEAEKYYRTQVDFGLAPVSEQEAKRFLEDIYAPDLSNISVVQAAALPFFRRRKLYQYIDKTFEPAYVYYYLYKPGDARLMNWTTESIKGLVTEEFKLEPSTVIPYVRFYNFFVRGQNNQFIIVEKPEDIVWQSEATEEDQVELNRHLIPLAYLGMDDKYYLLKGTGLIKDMLFRLELRIPSENMTIINPDTDLPMELEPGIVIFANEQLVAKDLKVAMHDFLR
ncbi:MAG TPA: hypothetical protein PKA28_09155 [Methylomusa anaerophila]|uniref:Photosystem I assembly protein Ycf3 n=1 Tax=Methylomusa anaerophila TaxID=1930071 RepID=A0A348AKR4_9FIRM|nr:hypothetical protein [Methylomusa anaerophila]BBB91662.1 photosystem I assembly protein Ycf3 [Methylomusa anaerophila]HML88604.1 hypothetical protein [Methylomusa anaerophila]